MLIKEPSASTAVSLISRYTYAVGHSLEKLARLTGAGSIKHHSCVPRCSYALCRSRLLVLPADE